jgi:transcriptional activator SPT7
MEPSKKKVKKNSGVAMGIADTLGEDEHAPGPDGAKTSNPASNNVKSEETAATAELSNSKGRVNSVISDAPTSDAVQNGNNDTAVPLTNGTSIDAS